jgi:hypothetical protein
VSEPHEPATPPGTDPRSIERRAALAENLGKEVWPADRETLVGKAQEANAPEHVIAELMRLPAGREFTNLQEVAAALGLGTEQQRF